MNKVKISGKLNRIILRIALLSFLILASVILGSGQFVFPPVRSQTPEKNEKTKKPVSLAIAPLPDPECNEPIEGFGGTHEKSIEVSEKVNISICVREGEVRVNGWNRNEIRAFVNHSGGIGFSVLEKGKLDKKAVWVKVLGYDPSKEGKFERDECVSGKVIELDVPIGATINIKSGESKTSIEAVAKVFVKNVGGDIFLSDVAQGIEARTYRGNITVKNSGGTMMLETTNGNIVAFDAASESIGDSFRAKSNSGAITLQKVNYRETEVNSSSGAINFVGELLSGGQYYFGSTDSLINLILPESSSSKIVAFYGYGNFDSQIPMTGVVRDNNSKVKSLSATIGGGEALLNFKTVSGKILIKKQ